MILFKIFKRILFYSYLVAQVNWLKFFKLRSKNAENVLLMFQTYPNDYFAYLSSGTVENDFALLNALLEHNQPFELCLGIKNLLKYKSKKIYFNISYFFNIEKKENYAESLLLFLSDLEKQGNALIPRKSDAAYWENKEYMQQQFQNLNIPHPKTWIVSKAEQLPSEQILDFPVLYKPFHSSGSVGIVEVKDYASLLETIEKEGRYGFFLQKRVNMTRDIRVIFVGDEIVLHYWRINNSKEWKPTSTGHGSSVDFDFFPEQWRDFIHQEYKKLNLKTGAFDITWENDDFDTTPLFLEVSPSYMPNPPQPKEYASLTYKAYKNKLFGKQAYYKSYIDLVFVIKKKLVTAYITQK